MPHQKNFFLFHIERERTRPIKWTSDPFFQLSEASPLQVLNLSIYQAMIPKHFGRYKCLVMALPLAHNPLLR